MLQPMPIIGEYRFRNDFLLQGTCRLQAALEISIGDRVIMAGFVLAYADEETFSLGPGHRDLREYGRCPTVGGAVGKLFGEQRKLFSFRHLPKWEVKPSSLGDDAACFLTMLAC